MHLLIPIAANLVLGILLVALFLSRRGADDARLPDGEAALLLFRAQCPDTDGVATVTADQRGALITLGRGTGVGLLQRRGRRWTARELAPHDLRSVAVTDGDTLSLALDDFGWPRAQFRLADPEVRAVWLARLQSFAASGAARLPESTHA